MYALLFALILVLFLMVKAKETFVLKIGDPRKEQDIVALERQKPGYRLFATWPDTCPPGQDYDAGLCYPSCEPGYNGVGPVCWADTQSRGIGVPVGLEPCPAGWSNDGLTCREPLGWNSCKFRGLFNECWGGATGGRIRGRMDNGGICDWPSDRGNLPGHLVDKSDPKNYKATHPDYVDGLCYKRCPADKPNRVPGMPYLCMKGNRLSYTRNAGKVPPMFGFGDDSPAPPAYKPTPLEFSCNE
jgi:hypothetical protein